jgi:hypothetical protein
VIIIHDWEGPSEKTLALVISGMRNSWESWDKGDSEYYPRGFEDEYADIFRLGEADKALAFKLLRAGPDHSKFLRQFPIIIDFTAPNYFLREWDTYKIGTACNRTSQMHVLGKIPFDTSMFSFDDVPPMYVESVLSLLNDARARWIDAGKRKGPEAEAWRAMVQLIPDSWNYRSLWSGSYQNLRQMYHARKHHRLREWREFCNWVETLPYAEFIVE